MILTRNRSWVILLIFGLLIFNNICFSQGMYGILGFRTHTLIDELEPGFLEEGGGGYGTPDAITYVQQGPFSSTSLGLGYCHVWQNKPKILGGSQFLNTYIYWDSKSVKWEGYEVVQGYDSPITFDRDGTVDVIDWNIGISYGLRFLNGINISPSIEYSFGRTSSWDFEPEYGNTLSFSISIGASRKTKLGHLGASVYSYPERYFAGSGGPVGESIEVRAEIPIIVYGGVVFLGILFIDPVLGSEILSDLSSSATGSSKSKYCHVFGKIKFVEYGEDYKVRIVDYGGSLDVKYVEYSADSVGEWQIVDFGEDYKIRIVKYGEDFTIRTVDFGEGCNK